MHLIADSLSFAAFWIAVGGAVLALALLVAALAVLGRRQRPVVEEIASMLREATARADATIDDLTLELEQERQESARSRQLSRISSTIDLDEVLSRTLEAAGALSGVDAAMVVVERGDNGRPLVATLGLSAEEAAGQQLTSIPDKQRAYGIVVSYRYAGRSLGEHGEPVRGALAVPIRSESEEPLGSLSVFWRSEDREPGEERLGQLDELASCAAPAIENSRRFREARHLADLDALTGLHNHRYFHETLTREVARAQRYERRLALIVFDIDDFKAINDRVGHLAGDEVLSEAAKRVASVVRGADVACRVGGDEFAVILPESALADAENLYRRLQGAMGTWRSDLVERLRLSAGIAELRPGEDSASFFKRADAALYRAKEFGKGRVIAANGQTSGSLQALEEQTPSDQT